MRLNKNIASKYVIPYDQGLSYLKVALLFLAAVSIVFNFWVAPALGVKAVLIFVTAYLTAIITESAYYMFSKNHSYQKASTYVEESFPEISGLIFAFLIPIGAPLFAVIFCVVASIIIVKMAFGGFSYNIFNIAAVGALIFYVSWPAYSVAHLTNVYWLDYVLNYVTTNLFDGILQSPPVASFETMMNSNVLYQGYLFFTTNTQAFLGFLPAIVILPVGLILIYLKVVDYIIPLSIGIFTIICGTVIGLFIADNTFADALYYGFYSLFSTMMLFVAFFVASDPVTSPVSRNGKIVYALIIVLVTMFIREVSSNVEGVIYGVVFANMFVALINAKSNIYSSIKKVTVSIILVLLFAFSSVFIGYNRSEETGNYEFYIQQGADQVVDTEDTTSSATE